MCLFVARLLEALYAVTGIAPLLTRAEVIKVGVTHNFSTGTNFQKLAL